MNVFNWWLLLGLMGAKYSLYSSFLVSKELLLFGPTVKFTRGFRGFLWANLKLNQDSILDKPAITRLGRLTPNLPTILLHRRGALCCSRLVWFPGGS